LVPKKIEKSIAPEKKVVPFFGATLVEIPK